jgi:starch-binding outer membrane protein SusE/F
MKKFSILSLLALVLFTGCKKYTYDTTENGEALGQFKLSSPSTGTVLVLNAATPAVKVDITWTAAKPGVGKAPTYKWVAALKGGDINAPILEVPSNNSGADTKLTLTFQQLDAALASKGIAAAATADLIWSVVADNGSVKMRAEEVNSIKITRFGDGVTPFTVYGPLSSTQNVELDPGSTSNTIVFRWQKSTPAVAANAVKYKLQIVKENDPFGTPFIIDVASDNNGNDTTRTFSHQAFSDSLTAKGYTDLGVIAQLKWRVVASSGNFSLPSTFSNILYIAREVKMYMVGSFQGWNPANGIRMIPDTRTGLLNNMFWCYIFLPANTEFKFLQGQAWGLPDYGGSGGNLTPGGGNIQVATAGVYRISMNKSTLKFNISAGRMGFVGGATAAGWDPPTTYTLASTQMRFTGTNQFFGVHTFTTGGWKMIDNNAWNNGSNSVDETRSYGANGGNNSKLEVNGPNFPDINTAGTYRVMWDATDIKNPKYEIYSDLRIVGAFQGWNFNTAPSMTYMGNGVWQRTGITLSGEFKFVAKEGWDFNYGGTGGVLSRGGGNLSVPNGTYTITVDEYNKTYTIL